MIAFIIRRFQSNEYMITGGALAKLAWENSHFNILTLIAILIDGQILFFIALSLSRRKAFKAVQVFRLLKAKATKRNAFFNIRHIEYQFHTRAKIKHADFRIKNSISFCGIIYRRSSQRTTEKKIAHAGETFQNWIKSICSKIIRR